MGGGRVRNLVGLRFSRLVVERLDRVGGNGRGAYWECLCDCGGRKVVRADSLKSGAIRSCGCLHSETARALRAKSVTHGMSHTRIYGLWLNMVRRCHNPKCDKYAWYGARGISVCDRWRNDFGAFLADMGERPDGMTLDRKDNNGNYEPENCRWATKEQQANNTRWNRFVDLRGERMTVAQAARALGVEYRKAHHLIYTGRELG